VTRLDAQQVGYLSQLLPKRANERAIRGTGLPLTETSESSRDTGQARAADGREVRRGV